MGEVPDAEGDGVEVDGVALDGREVFSVGFEEADAVGGFVRGGGEAFHALGEHFGVDVGDDDGGFVIVVYCGAVVEVAEGDVTCATGDVEDLLASW